MSPSTVNTTSTVVLITGANRGIGLGWLRTYASRDDHTIIAGIRTLSNSKVFASLPTGSNTTIIPLELETSSSKSCLSAASTLQSQHKVTHINVLVSNAGIAKTFETVQDTTVEQMTEHFQVNTLGPLNLFQAFSPLLKNAHEPKFVALSTVFASIGGMQDYQFPDAAYGVSKAGANFLLRKIHFENEWLVAFPVHPGWVQTEQGNGGAKRFGMEQAPLTVDESVAGMVDKIDIATRESASGTFQAFDGNNVAW